MSSPRRIVTASAAAASVLALSLVAVTSAADAPAPTPVVSLRAAVTPGGPSFAPGTPLTLRIDTRFASEPAGGDFVLEQADYLFGHGARFNGALFSSCSAAKLRAARGALRVCPKGSKIGGGVATGRAVAVGITSSARVTAFNGPGGRSITMNISVLNPALINATISAPITRLRGRYEFKLSTSVPSELQTVLGGDIVVNGIDITAGATRVIDGKRRGYFEVRRCPANGSVVRGDFTYVQGVRASAETTAIC